MRGRHTDICRCWLPGTRWYVLHDYISMPRTSEIFHGKEPLVSWWGWDTHIVRGEHDLTCTPKPGKQFTSRTPRCLIGLEGNIYIYVKLNHIISSLLESLTQSSELYIPKKHSLPVSSGMDARKRCQLGWFNQCMKVLWPRESILFHPSIPTILSYGIGCLKTSFQPIPQIMKTWLKGMVSGTSVPSLLQ